MVNPTTEQTVGRIPEGTAEDADRAVRAARAAFDEWSRRTPYERAGFSAAIGAKLAERGDELAALFTTELGMPLALVAHDPGRPAVGRRSPRSPSSPSRSSGRRRWATR